MEPVVRPKGPRLATLIPHSGFWVFTGVAAALENERVPVLADGMMLLGATAAAVSDAPADHAAHDANVIYLRALKTIDLAFDRDVLERRRHRFAPDVRADERLPHRQCPRYV